LPHTNYITATSHVTQIVKNISTSPQDNHKLFLDLTTHETRTHID